MGGWSRPISSRWVVVALAWAVWTTLQKQVNPASIFLRQRWSSTLTVTHLSVGKKVWGENQRVDWRWHGAFNSNFFLSFYGFIDGTLRATGWEYKASAHGTPTLPTELMCTPMLFHVVSWSLKCGQLVEQGQEKCVCVVVNVMQVWNVLIVLAMQCLSTKSYLTLRNISVISTTSPLYMHRLFTPAFRGVRDYTGHSLAKQFPIATKPTCLIRLECFILVLFISLYFYWTHMGICSVSLFV